MSAEPSIKSTPFDSAVSEVQTKIEELKTTLATLLRLQGEYGGAPVAQSRGAETAISHDTFFNMTIGDAAKKYLAMVKSTKSTAEIGTALEQGGLKHSSKAFPTTVRSILGQREDFTRVPNGDWGLTEWYPGMGRGKKPKAEKSAKPKSKAKAAKTGKSAETPAGGPTRKQRIMATIKTDTGKAWTAGEIATATNDERRLIQATMSVMASGGELSKDPDGGYRLPKPGSANAA